MKTQARFHGSIHELDADRWAALWRSDNPFIRHEFLAALEDSGCVSERTGWEPQHLALYEGGTLVGAMPLYVKHHSQGEFVFDFSWAEAYHQFGIPYYPKLLTAIPFTPSSGPRVAFAGDSDPDKGWQLLLDAVNRRLDAEQWSGWHLLFPRESPGACSDTTTLLERRDVQFHWRNRGYRNFDSFLAELKSSRRKNLRKERAKVADSGIAVERATGHEITAADWDHFYRCYCETYLRRSGHAGYLNRAFFEQLLRTMPEQLLLVTARSEAGPVASALFLFDDECLYGRYWGALGDIDYLHFECCFYQGIEFCIGNHIARFDPGTQGEHKLLRGFEPVTTHSWHLLADQRFREAIGRFLEQEKEGVESYGRQVADFLPFRKSERRKRPPGQDESIVR